MFSAVDFAHLLLGADNYMGPRDVFLSLFSVLRTLEPVQQVLTEGTVEVEN